MIDYGQIIENLELEGVERLLTSLGIPYRDTEAALIMPTVCHNADIEEASWKLYYYKNSHKVNISEKMINRIKYEKPKRLYNIYDLGGELIYNDIKVFSDGRADLYSKYSLRDIINISKLDGDYKEKIDYYNFDYFLVNNKFKIFNYLDENDNYELIYNDKDIYLYKKIKEINY